MKITTEIMRLARDMFNSGNTITEIAKKLGISAVAIGYIIRAQSAFSSEEVETIARLRKEKVSVINVAKAIGKHPGTVAACIADLEEKGVLPKKDRSSPNEVCPYSPDCEKCPLPDCGIAARRAVIVNKIDADIHLDQVTRTGRW